jgi:hypothetical protein
MGSTVVDPLIVNALLAAWLVAGIWTMTKAEIKNTSVVAVLIRNLIFSSHVEFS